MGITFKTIALCVAVATFGIAHSNGVDDKARVIAATKAAFPRSPPRTQRKTGRSQSKLPITIRTAAERTLSATRTGYLPPITRKAS